MKLRIYKDHIAHNLAIDIIKVENNKTYQAKPIDLKFTEVKEGLIQTPALQFNLLLDEQIYPSLVESVQWLGLPLPTTEAIKGELEATKRHLSDIQRAYYKLLDATNEN